MILWPLKPFPKDISCYGSNHMKDESQPEFTIMYSYERFHTEMRYEREFNPKLDSYQLHKFFPVDDEERFPEEMANMREFENGQFYRYDPNRVAKIMKTVNWSCNEMRNSAVNLLKECSSIKKTHALSLLQHEISDTEVRSFAVNTLKKISNRYLANFMPQLVQALKFEAHHHSPLGEMLLFRALNSARIVGHAFFWALNSALYDPYSFERIFLYYERFLFLSPYYRFDMFLQSKVNEAIIDVNYHAINNIKEKSDELAAKVNEKIELVQNVLGINYFVLPHMPDIPIDRILDFDTRKSKNQTVMLE